MKTLNYSTTLAVISCGECEIPFAIPQSLDRTKRQDGATFFCPNGHKICYGNAENDQLKRQLEQARREREWAETARKAARDQAQAAGRSAAAYKGHLTRTRKRVAAGVCPCCTRTFQNLKRHMEGQHPGYAEAVPDA